jgi:hypothetical protein
MDEIKKALRVLADQLSTMDEAQLKEAGVFTVRAMNLVGLADWLLYLTTEPGKRRPDAPAAYQDAVEELQKITEFYVRLAERTRESPEIAPRSRPC